MSFKTILSGFVFAGLTLGIAQAENVRLPDEQVMPIIRSLSKQIGSTTNVIKKIDGAKAGAFWNSKESYQKDLNGLLDDALGLILPDTYPQIKNKLSMNDAALVKLLAEKSEWKEIAETGIFPNDTIWAKTKDAVKGVSKSILGGDDEIVAAKAEARIQISKIDQEINDTTQERQQLFNSLSQVLNAKYGIKWSIDQARAALIQVNGETIVEGQIVPRILFSIEARLKELQALGPDATKAREYYGVAVITRLVMLRLYEKHLQDYNQVWIPKLDELLKKNADEMITLKATEAEKKHNKVVIEKNIETRLKLASAITKYQSILLTRRDKTQEMLEAATEDAKVAIQTLSVLEDLSDFSLEANRNIEEYFTLSTLEGPELLPLDNDELINQFIDLSGKIAGS